MKAQRQVTRFLVSKAVALMGAGETPADLATGEIGVFNYNTGLSIASGTTATPFFIGVGYENGPRRSAGKILNANIRNVNVQCYTAGVEQVIEIANFCAECAKDYAIKFDISAPNAWHEYGMQPLMQTFTYTTACCNDGTASCYDLVKALRDVIEDDPRGIFDVKLINPDDTGDVDATAINEETYDPDVDGCPFMQITVNTPALLNFCGIPETYSFPSGVTAVASLQGFECCESATTITTIRNQVYPQGAGIDVKYDEWFAAGNAEVGPERLTVSGVTSSTALNADTAATYAILSIDYDDPHEAAGTLHSEPKSLQLAIPCDAAVLATIGNVLDTLFTPATDASLTACDCD